MAGGSALFSVPLEAKYRAPSRCSARWGGCQRVGLASLPRRIPTAGPDPDAHPWCAMVARGLPPCGAASGGVERQPCAGCSTGGDGEVPAVLVFPSTERRRNRTFQAEGCSALPVLKRRGFCAGMASQAGTSLTALRLRDGDCDGQGRWSGWVADRHASCKAPGRGCYRRDGGSCCGLRSSLTRTDRAPSYPIPA